MRTRSWVLPDIVLNNWARTPCAYSAPSTQSWVDGQDAIVCSYCCRPQTDGPCTPFFDSSGRYSKASPQRVRSDGRLLHRPPRDPPAGGIIERVIQTTQHQFEAEVRAGKILTLDEMNRYFQAWLHADYHQTVHSGSGQTPQARFEESSRFRRHVKLSDVLEFFGVQEKRKVHEDYSDVQVDNRFFLVDGKLRGDQVLVRYDPFSALDEVRLYSLRGEFLAVARRYDRERGAHPSPEPRADQTAHVYGWLLCHALPPMSR